MKKNDWTKSIELCYGIRNDNGNGNCGNGRGDHHLSNGYGCKVCILGRD